MFHFAFCGYIRDVRGYAGNRIFWMAIEDRGFVLNATKSQSANHNKTGIPDPAVIILQQVKVILCGYGLLMVQ